MTSARSTILFGDDGSPGADLAWLWINSQSWPGWRLEVLHAVAPPVGPPLPKERTEPHPWTPPVPRVPFRESAIDEVVHLTAESDPRLVLERPSDLVVVGARGAGFLKSMHLGSTVEWLLSRPPAPLVIARSGRPVTSVLVCHDGSVHADRAVRAIGSMPWISGVHVTLLWTDDRRGTVMPELGDVAAGTDRRRCAGRHPGAGRQADEGDPRPRRRAPSGPRRAGNPWAHGHRTVAGRLHRRSSGSDGALLRPPGLRRRLTSQPPAQTSSSMPSGSRKNNDHRPPSCWMSPMSMPAATRRSRICSSVAGESTAMPK